MAFHLNPFSNYTPKDRGALLPGSFLPLLYRSKWNGMILKLRFRSLKGFLFASIFWVLELRKTEFRTLEIGALHFRNVLLQGTVVEGWTVTSRDQGGLKKSVRKDLKIQVNAMGMYKLDEPHSDNVCKIYT